MKLLLKIYCLYYILTCRFRRNGKGRGNILLLFPGGIGDVMLDAQGVAKLYDYYRSNGKKLYIGCSDAVYKMLCRIQELSGVIFIPCRINDVSANRKDCIDAFKEVVEELDIVEFEQVITRLVRTTTEAFSVAARLKTNERTVLLCDGKQVARKKKIITKILGFTADRVIESSNTMTQSQMFRELAETLGVEHYPISITYLPPVEGYKPVTSEYITVTVDSNVTRRRWQTNNYIRLIGWLRKNFEYSIVLCGNNVPAEEIKEYTEAFDGDNTVLNMIDKTPIDEWTELIRNARFHIGVDSGSIHIAASVGTKAFCLTGKWDFERFFPYVVEERRHGTEAPICVYSTETSDLLCAGCATEKEYGWGNRECLKKCRTGSPCECLEKITVDDVICAIQDAESHGFI